MKVITKILRRILFFAFGLLVMVNAFGQASKQDRLKVYQLNYKIDIPLTAGLIATGIYGYSQLGNKLILDSIQINGLNKK